MAGTQYRGSEITDVDQFLTSLGRVLEVVNAGSERVEIPHHEVDRIDAVVLHVGDVFGVGAAKTEAFSDIFTALIRDHGG